MFPSSLNSTKLTSVIKELADSQSGEDPHVSFIFKSNDVGISDGRASTFAKREDEHVSFILKFDEFDISDKRASAFAKREDQHVSFTLKFDEFDISDKRASTKR